MRVDGVMGGQCVLGLHHRSANSCFICSGICVWPPSCSDRFPADLAEMGESQQSKMGLVGTDVSLKCFVAQIGCRSLEAFGPLLMPLGKRI